MTVSANAYPCPACGGPASLAAGCPRCRRPPDPAAAEVVRLDAEIVGLTGRVEQARQAYAALAATLRDTQRRRDELAAQVRAAVLASRSAARTQPEPAQTGIPASVPAPVAGRTTAPAPGSGPGSGAAATVRPEASTRTVQNVLFILGGLLVGVAAIIFTVVAWSTVGIAGRATILAVLTALALAAPLLARWRGLTATAETFAALGLLLVVLDGYAVWSVDLFGVADWPGTRYAALAGGASAAIAGGYGLATRLATPWFAAFLAAQPVLPLLVVELDPGVSGWALVFAAVAAADLAVVGLLRRRPAGPVMGEPGPPPETVAPEPTTAQDPAVAGQPRGIRLARQAVAWSGHGLALLVAGAYGLVALLVAAGPGPAAILSGGPLLLVVLLILAGAVLVRQPVPQAIAGALLVITLGAAAIRPVAETDWPLLVAAAAIVALLAAAVAGAAPLLPAAIRPGHRAGGLLLASPLAVTVGAMALAVAAVVAVRSLPAGRAATDPVDLFDWQLTVAVPLVATAFVLLLPAAGRLPTALVGGAMTVLAVPAAVALPFWALAALEFALAVPLVLGAARHPGRRSLLPVLAAVTGAALAGHAVLVAFARPAAATVALAALSLLGLAAAALAGQGRQIPVALATSGPAVPAPAVPAPVGSGPAGSAAVGPASVGSAPVGPASVGAAHAGTADGRRRVIGGVWLGVAFTAAPAVAVAALHTGGAAPWWQSRAALTAAMLLVGALVAVRRWWPAYRSYAGAAVALCALVTGLAPSAAGLAEPAGSYAAVGLLAVAVALLVVGPHRSTRPIVSGTTSPIEAGGVLLFAAGVGLLLRVAFVVVPAAAGLLLAPYGWLGEIWAGAPEGVGLAPIVVPIRADAAAALGILTVVAGVAGWLARRTRIGVGLAALPVGLVAVLAGLAALGAGWPTVPAVALASGLGCLFAATVPARGARTAPVTVPLGLALVGGGLAGLQATPASSLTALGAAVAVTATIGAAARTGLARVAGALAAAAAGMLLAVAASRAADLPLRVAALAVLAVAAVVLAAGTALRSRRPVEATALAAAGHAGAVVALLLTTGHLRYAAVICTLWGVALGLSALRPGESAGRRWVFAAVAAGAELAGAWLLLAAGDVAVLEAYTLPAAGLGLLAGWFAVRTWPGLNSWIGYGPGLAAALLPSLASVLAAGEQPWRRLLLGAGALVAVLLGARWRRQAPVVLAGGTLAVLACYELVIVWDRLPRWAFLAAGGFALIGLATTYERRRRDVARLRSAVGRMT
ncbi:hypothetical protein O7627_27965 [Solwaraspora sp. WMMD1047]|uniref:SCO7613 C-terminal domain-containing membrane protein n=1 Tax=Solwaraspora sp. WMMD1047 TaxID=3016102 RepID=UPI002417EDC1|nr:hypothetical protein [Solwaraspora sp. WMMD1047]MDG4833114.1 hypothetical protein [Solwaraspora sp. WMMD1047]